MTDQIPSLTDRQLKTYEVLHRIKMAKIAFWVILGAFIVVLIALLVAAFTTLAGPRIEWAFATIDSLLGVCFHQVVRYLFPTKRNPKDPQ
jgi:hypothetical protein